MLAVEGIKSFIADEECSGPPYIDGIVLIFSVDATVVLAGNNSLTLVSPDFNVAEVGDFVEIGVSVPINVAKMLVVLIGPASEVFDDAG